MKKSVLAVLFTLILCSCSKREEVLSEKTDTDLYHRIQTKYSSTVAGFDRVSYEINDPLSTSYYKIKDSIIGFWGISRNVSSLNSIHYFQELDLGSTYYVDREVISLEELDSDQIEFTVRFIEANDEAFRYACFIIAPADSIPFQSNTNEKLLPLYRQQKSGVFSDPIYGAIDLFDPYSHLEAFKKDAARHGVDLSHISRSDMELTWEPDSYTESDGYAFKVCDPNKLGIGLRQTDWDERIVADLNEFRISLMWHEFGHAILGLQHLCQGGHIMSGRHQNPQIIENDSECESEYITVGGLSFDHPDSYRNFQRAVKDMFDGYFQIQYNCSSGKQGVILD
jgi:hypothetical protein